MRVGKIPLFLYELYEDSFPESTAAGGYAKRRPTGALLQGNRARWHFENADGRENAI